MSDSERSGAVSRDYSGRSLSGASKKLLLSVISSQSLRLSDSEGSGAVSRDYSGRSLSGLKKFTLSWE